MSVAPSFKQKLRDDCEMLSEVGLMDYSLMLWAIKTESVAVEETKVGFPHPSPCDAIQLGLGLGLGRGCDSSPLTL